MALASEVSAFGAQAVAPAVLVPALLASALLASGAPHQGFADWRHFAVAQQAASKTDFETYQTSSPLMRVKKASLSPYHANVISN